jgi:hypothetical protein
MAGQEEVEEQRVDHATRKRINQLDARYKMVARRLTLAVVGLAVAVGIGFFQLRSEANARRDQTCTLFERQHSSTVSRLRDTYSYLEDLAPHERDDRINAAVLAGLPKLEQEAQANVEPDFCNEDGVGQPEPGAVIPRRPEDLNTGGGDGRRTLAPRRWVPATVLA